VFHWLKKSIHIPWKMLLLKIRIAKTKRRIWFKKVKKWWMNNKRSLLKSNKNRLLKKRKWRKLRSKWRSKLLKQNCFKLKLTRWKLNNLKQLPKQKLHWTRKMPPKLSWRKLKHKSKKLFQLMNLRNHSTLWVVVTLYKERKKDKMLINLRLTKLPKKKNLNKKVKLINFLRNVKTTKMRLLPRSRVDNTVTLLRFTWKELIHWKVLSKTSHCGSKNLLSMKPRCSTTFLFATIKIWTVNLKLNTRPKSLIVPNGFLTQRCLSKLSWEEERLTRLSKNSWKPRKTCLVLNHWMPITNRHLKFWIDAIKLSKKFMAIKFQRSRRDHQLNLLSQLLNRLNKN